MLERSETGTPLLVVDISHGVKNSHERPEGGRKPGTVGGCNYSRDSLGFGQSERLPVILAVGVDARERKIKWEDSPGFELLFLPPSDAPQATLFAAPRQRPGALPAGL
jgi:hypothetical protein